MPFGKYRTSDEKHVVLSHVIPHSVSNAFRQIPHFRLSVVAEDGQAAVGLQCLSANTALPTTGWTISVMEVEQCLQCLSANTALPTSRFALLQDFIQNVVSNAFRQIPHFRRQLLKLLGPMEVGRLQCLSANTALPTNCQEMPQEMRTSSLQCLSANTALPTAYNAFNQGTGYSSLQCLSANTALPTRRTRQGQENYHLGVSNAFRQIPHFRQNINSEKTKSLAFCLQCLSANTALPTN